MLEKKIYELKTELWKELGITSYQWEKRKEDLLRWMSEFFNYEILPGKPVRIQIKEIYGDYKPLPRKGYDSKERDELTAQKKKDYETFTIAALGTEFKPNSKSKIARDAIDDFGFEKYGHNNQEAVAKRFIKPAFEERTETNDKHVWVWYFDYSPLDKETLEDWKNILKEEYISEEEAAKAFYKQEQGQDVSKEKQYYKNAMERFKDNL